MTQLGLEYDLHVCLLISSLVIMWVVCGVLAYGGFLARHYQVWSTNPLLACDHDRWFEDSARCARLYLLLGWIGLLIVLWTGGMKHGLILRNPKKKEQESDPTLTAGLE